MKTEKRVMPALLCIPDISGYTKFMSEVKIEKSRRIIPVLLDNIIKSNFLNFDVAEVEGDAILFYKTGKPPVLSEVVRQCQKIHNTFGKTLRKLEQVVLQSKEVTPARLGLKIVVHYGQITFSKIGNVVKPIGEDIIIAHKLLKNSIPGHEYLLLSENYLLSQSQKEIYKVFKNGELQENEDVYKHIGKVKYHYSTFYSNSKTERSK